MTKVIKTGVPLDASLLCASIDLSVLDGKPVGGKALPGALMGQERALDAIRMAAKIPHEDFNLFVLGNQGYGRHTAVSAILEEEAQQRPVPSDWVYVNNFDTPDKPQAIELPPGLALSLKQAMDALIDNLANDIPAHFESESYQNQRRKLEQEFGETNENAFSGLIEETKKNELALLRTPMGFAIAPTKDGKPIKAEDFEALPVDQQDAINSKVEAANEKLEAVLKEIPKYEKAHRRTIELLNKSMAEQGVDEAMLPIYAQFEKITILKSYFDAVHADLIENAELFLKDGSAAQAGPFPVATTKHYKEPQFRRYTVNVMVSNTPDGHRGAPVEVEYLPTLANLIGRVEHLSEMGVLFTDFTMIKPGALHRANGGYLILDVRQLLSEPFAWDALKRCLKSGQISIVSAAERFSLATTTSLEPDPIPLNLRIALVGERSLYYLLMAYDPEFAPLFKMQADFNDGVFLTEETVPQYVELVHSIARDKTLLSPDPAGLQRLIIEGTRLADDSQKVSLDLGRLSDILREANYWAMAAGHKTITADDIDRAVAEAETRAGRMRELTQEAINRETLLIETTGAAVGQINALSVLELGNYRFGRPSLVSARARMGRGKVVDIEREVELGGPLHSKGVLILSGYLATHYALDTPMSLWASIVFEQSYGGIDGDSASAAELFALLSTLANVPISQAFAVTGSVNQQGRIQPIGGVNEKIEGFFDVCAGRGLTGDQGVLIPDTNVKHLALRSRVIDAVRADKFKIIPIATIDEGIALLTSRKAGKRSKKGAFPATSINGLVEARLRSFAEGLRSFGAMVDPGKGNGVAGK